MIHYIFPNKDIKSKNWSEVISSEVRQPIQLNGDIRESLFLVLKYLLLRKKYIYFFRYLNDYDNFILTLFKFFFEFLICFLTSLSKNKVRWVAHNLNRETSEYYPLITKIRRKVIAYYSESIYLTSELLYPEAQKIKPFSKNKEKLKITSFGGKIESDISLSIEIEKSINFIKSTKENVKFGLCATSLSEKCYHLRNISKLLDKLNNNSDSFTVMILVADFKSDSKGRKLWVDLFNELSLRDDVVIFHQGNVSEEYLASNIDFIYRTLSDISIPMTLYNACNFKIPIVTDDLGFLKFVVRHYSVGIILDFYDERDFSKIFYERLYEINISSFDKFLLDNNWDIGGKSLI